MKTDFKTFSMDIFLLLIQEAVASYKGKYVHGVLVKMSKLAKEKKYG